jgi:hypothetical protein
MPLAFKAAPPAFGTLGETFSNTKFRGKAASGAIAVDRADASKVIDVIIAVNKDTPFPGALALRFVKGTNALLGFTRFPSTCVLELDGVEAKLTRDFFQKVWDKLEELSIPYTLHWGKINFNLTPQRLKNMYGEANVNKWLESRKQLLDEQTRKVFCNGFMTQCGLDV